MNVQRTKLLVIIQQLVGINDKTLINFFTFIMHMKLANAIKLPVGGNELN